MRNVSFMHTGEQMRLGAAAARASADGYAGYVPGGKDLTRRKGWYWAEVGMFLCAVERTQGIKPGQIVEAFGVIELLDVRREPLYHCTDKDARREGFPDLGGAGFVAMFCGHMRVDRRQRITRVVFRHVDVRRIEAARRAATCNQLRALGIYPT